MDSSTNNNASNAIKTNRKSGNYHLDHLYCHTTNDNQYIRANSGNDMMSLFKENKQLKAMLLLHLDLIQEQCDQLNSKDKQLLSLKKDNENLRSEINRLVADQQKYKSNSQPPVIVSQTVVPYKPTTDKPQLQTTQNTLSEINAKCDILKKVSLKLYGNCTLKLNKLSEQVDNTDHKKQQQQQQQHHRSVMSVVPITVTATSQQPQQQTTNKQSNIIKLGPSVQSQNQPVAVKTQFTPKFNGTVANQNNIKIVNSVSNDGATNIIGECNGKYISKIILQRVQTSDGDVELEQLVIKNDNSDEYVGDSKDILVIPHERPCSNAVKHENNLQQKLVQTSQGVKVEEEDEIKPLILNELDEKYVEPADIANNHGDDEDAEMYTESITSVKRRGFKTTPMHYLSREWQMDELEAEVNKQIADMVEEKGTLDEQINLEIPRWVIKDVHGLYSIEGTEDMSDEIFLKRHSRFEHDEKKRKKWDVQRIREQRTIERLKRRHCKDELINQKNQEEPISFYPVSEDIKFVQITENLPVQAFGEIIPQIFMQDFLPPWMNRPINGGDTSHHSLSITRSEKSVQKDTHILFVKKNRVRRHYTSTSSHPSFQSSGRGKDVKRLQNASRRYNKDKE